MPSTTVASLISGSTTATKSATGSIRDQDPSTGAATATGLAKAGEGENGNTEQGLSVGVAAGIGIGIGLGTILLIGTAMFLIRLYRRRLRGSQVQDCYEAGQVSVPSYYSQQQLQGHQRHPEPQEPHELSTERVPSELSAERI
ncbi:hypothetical protein GGR58DRAFT_481487 [Xylaria digitata]|nr:hypothetical protein GGR58DRAFT_481487 [Xylaria digitata]